MSIATDITELERQLAEVQAAITKTLQSQDYSVEGKRNRRAELISLRGLRADVKKELSNLRSTNAGTNRMYATRSTL